MPVEFTLPELGENVEKGDVIRVLVGVGDTVTKEQPLLELETDKATIEVPSPVSGTIAEVRVKAGEKVKVGQSVFLIEEAAGAPAKAAAPAAARAGRPRAGCSRAGYPRAASGTAIGPGGRHRGRASRRGAAARAAVVRARPIGARVAIGTPVCARARRGHRGGAGHRARRPDRTDGHQAARLPVARRRGRRRACRGSAAARSGEVGRHRGAADVERAAQDGRAPLGCLAGAARDPARPRRRLRARGLPRGQRIAGRASRRQAHRSRRSC